MSDDSRDGLDRLSRRTLFKLAGAGLAAWGCSSRPAREILPYTVQPPEVTPGVARYFATTLVEDGFATGVVVESHEGRPTKLEGNPDHPASLGATRAIEQAAVLSLYDPQRAREVTDGGVPASWSAVERWLAEVRRTRGEGLQIVAEPTTSPMMVELAQRIRAALPETGFTFWAPFAPRASLAGNRLAFGRVLQTQLDLGRADVIVALDADLVAEHPMALAHARRIADRRRVVDGSSAMSRLYAIESAYTPTGVIADHRFAVPSSQVERIALALLGALSAGAHGGQVADAPVWIGAVARDLARTAGRCAVVAGERQPAVVHAIVAAINAQLASSCVSYSEPVAFEAGADNHALGPLVGNLERGEVGALLVLGGNPAYTAPADLAFAHAMARADTSLYVGLYMNETAAACRMMVPGLHDLERWGAARAYDGTLAPQQPLIEPLLGGRANEDILHALLNDPAATARERTVAAWQRLVPDENFERALARGVVDGTAAPRVAVELAWNALTPVLAAAGQRMRPGLELSLAPSPTVHDGRYTNNPWLLELPEPLTKLVWDNAAQLSPRTAARLGVGTGDVLSIAVDRRAIDVPAIVVPGHADDALTLHAGFGRTGDEQVARGVGVNAFALWTIEQGWHPAVDVAPRDAHRELAITQQQWSDHDRPLALGGTLAQLAGDAEFRQQLASQRGVPPSIIAAFPQRGAQWAMSIDLTTCTGCSACVMACSAENNVPVVGRTRVLSSREMHWLRIDRYADDAGTIAVQPMACQHCEKAPCEYVCPVGATTHSPDGLNEMAYNRCVGTRFCSNNCPYKVRRFNWFDFKVHSGLRVLGKNPDVTVRDRGVMEKCTYCVQRIRRAEIDARVASTELGEVRTACQQACPTQAITFGSLTDPQSAVTAHRARPHSFAVLHDQGTLPRTRYLARIRNPNPEIA